MHPLRDVLLSQDWRSWRWWCWRR